ncbi:uncharacterized protein LAJ45_04988 [Morchella importuna]|uniref:uncharacterized protein n=1 Tax=Morchella importuna TaxID=1174673 RepID=UPI001E8CDCF3|nr:uncharacterized protein LAJ45_04988 [Morchella importuna]KAH8150807.1 hypothetical protein LAJ45_04988 [Morchella importuna]
MPVCSPVDAKTAILHKPTIQLDVLVSTLLLHPQGQFRSSCFLELLWIGGWGTYNSLRARYTLITQSSLCTSSLASSSWVFKSLSSRLFLVLRLRGRKDIQLYPFLSF